MRERMEALAANFTEDQGGPGDARTREQIRRALAGTSTPRVPVASRRLRLASGVPRLCGNYVGTTAARRE